MIAKSVQKDTGVIKLIKEKHQLYVRKEHINIKLENLFVIIVLMAIIVTKKDPCIARFVQEDTGAVKTIKESHQYLALLEHTKIK